jgi:hypothetical protein
VAATLTPQTVAAAVLEHWIETGNPATVRALAERLGRSERILRHLINDVHHGTVPGTVYRPTYIERTSKQYPGLVELPPAKAAAWMPGEPEIRAAILRLRKGEV